MLHVRHFILTGLVCMGAVFGCDFLGTGGNGNTNTNSNNNGNANSNNNTNSNNNSNNNNNSNLNSNENENENDNENSNTNGNDNDNTNGNDNDNSNGNDNTGQDEFAVFVDPETGFQTTIVYDANRDTARFRLSDDSVVFQDGMAYDIGEWEVDGLYLDEEQFFIVTFGTEDGQRRAFFTEVAMPGVICDFFVEDGDFQMVPSTQHVPSE